MKHTKNTALLAALALTACMSTACTADRSSETSKPSADAGKVADTATASAAPAKDGKKSITISETNAFTSMNSDSKTGNKDINSKVGAAMFASLFSVTPELKVKINTEIGNIEKISDSPLKVKYSVKETTKWSDGNPVDAGDLMLAWAFNSGYYDSYKKVKDKETGTQYFKYAGSKDGLKDSLLPVIGEDGRSITVEYTKPFADWQITMNLPSTPAHVVAKRAKLADENALIELFKKTPKGNPDAPVEEPQMAAVAKVWNEDFNFKSLPDDKELYLASGPFIAKEIVKDQSMTMVRNDKFGGTPAKLDEVTVRYISDVNTAITALENGEADVIAPQPSADTLTRLDKLKPKGFNVHRGDEMAYDHIDLTIDGPFKDKAVREAFMHCVPRQQIVDLVVGPMKPGSKPLNSQLFVSTVPGYDKAIAANSSSQFSAVNIEKSKELLNGQKPAVKILYFNGNPNRLNTFTLIRESCKKAGFDIQDGGQPKGEWTKSLVAGGDHHASIFGWVSGGVGNSSLGQIFKSTGGSNFTKFNSPALDQLAEKLAETLDPAEQDRIKTEADKILFEERYGLPLFQSVGVVAHKENVKGIQYMPASPGVWWNIDELTVD